MSCVLSLKALQEVSERCDEFAGSKMCCVFAHIKSVFCSEGARARLLKQLRDILVLFPKFEKGNGEYKVRCGRTLC